MIVYMEESGKARWLLELGRGLGLGLGHLGCSGLCLPRAFTRIPFLRRTPDPGRLTLLLSKIESGEGSEC